MADECKCKLIGNAANIFVTTRGLAKILDFGLANLQESETPEQQVPLADQQMSGEWNPTLTLTRTGTAIGTAGYMSPEQVQGEKLDARTFNWLWRAL